MSNDTFNTIFINVCGLVCMGAGLIVAIGMLLYWAFSRGYKNEKTQGDKK